MSDRVLIVDDSLTVRMDLVAAFEQAGFEPAPCASADEARRSLLGGTISIVILDVVLPDGDGVELMKEIRSAPSAAGAPILLLSSEAEVRDRIRGLATGADEYIGKPYDVNYIIARSKELLGSLDQPKAGKTSVLLIDDSPTYREALKHSLEAEGYNVLVAETGEEGLRLAALARPNVMIVDGFLPGIDGPTVIRHVRLDAALRGTICLLLTASVERNIEPAILDAGADAFLRKEEDVSFLLARLAAVLRGAGDQEFIAQSRSLLGPKRILAIDDSPTYLTEVAAALRGEGYDVALGQSGEEAIALLNVQSFDCILLDLLMPGLSGNETCRRIKSTRALRDIPVIILTSLEETEALLEGLGAGADDYIAKSSDLEVLKARVRAQIRRRQIEDENRRIGDRLLRSELEAAKARAAQELAETRARLIEELKTKNQELEAFSYSVSHDLRAPLRHICGFSEILLADYKDKLDEDGKTRLQHIIEAANRMGELIDDLLRLSRISRASLTPSRVDLTGLAESLAADFRSAAPDRSTQFVIQSGLTAEGDQGLLRIALENLLGNAWKFTSKKSGASITFGAIQDESAPIFFVRDDGAGFEMDYAKKLFAPFQRLHSDAEFSGTGIGLAIVHRVIHRHGGKIWAEAEVGKGASFYWTLAHKLDVCPDYSGSISPSV